MLPSVVHRPVVGQVTNNQNIQISQKVDVLQKKIMTWFEINTKILLGALIAITV